ncbi:MAG: DUF89 family protein [Chloroflexi bacterium]|nr:DUF89 family protein [Chloroflexota bacterium]
MINSRQLVPGLPVPAPICSDIPGTWAHSTTTIRMPEIARRMLAENNFPPDTVSRVQALIDDIPAVPIRLLKQEKAPDTAAWNYAIHPYLGQDWLEPPWFVVETYFYRRLLEATGYFGPGQGQGLDPFAYQKRQGLLTARPVISTISSRLQAWLDLGWQEDYCAALVAIDLWGNRADLSLWPVEEGGESIQADWEGAEAQNLVDDTVQLTAYLSDHQGVRIDFMIDNAGLELVADLALADYLLATTAAQTVTFHLKMHPTFVSDATIVDVQETAAFLAAQEVPAVAAFGSRLENYLATSRLLLRDNPFWTSPLAFWEMPADLRKDLSQSHLIISKGDANYRRLLGDRHWPYTTSFQAIMAYTPAPLLALRALKAEVAAGLSAEQIARLNKEDEEWMVNGRWGVIQFVQ